MAAARAPREVRARAAGGGAGMAKHLKAGGAAVEACAARVDCSAAESVVAKHVTEVGERAPEATEKEVAAEGEMAQQRVEEAREVVARVVATAEAAAMVLLPAAARAAGAMAMAAAEMAAVVMAVAAMAMAEAAMAEAAERAAAAETVVAMAVAMTAAGAVPGKLRLCHRARAR